MRHIAYKRIRLHLRKIFANVKCLSSSEMDLAALLCTNKFRRLIQYDTRAVRLVNYSQPVNALYWIIETKKFMPI